MRGESNQTSASSRWSGDLSTLLASTYLGGTSDDEGNGILIDGAGKVYVVGWTNSPDFPVVDASPYRGGLRDGFVVKLNSDLTRLEAARFVGGARDDVAQAIAVYEPTGTLYVTGWTQSSDFMHDDPGAFFQYHHGATSQNDFLHDNAFVARLTTTDLRSRDTAIIGGIDHDRGLAITPGWVDHGRGYEPVVVVGSATARSTVFEATLDGVFPTTRGVVDYGARSGGWVLVLSYHLAGLDYATMVAPGHGAAPPNFRFDTAVRGVAVTEDEEVVVAGYVFGCSGLRVTVGAFATECANPGSIAREGFVTRLSGTLDEVLVGTYLGGGGHDLIMGMIRLRNAAGDYEVVVAGYTYSADFPTTVGAHDGTHNGDADAFVAKLPDDLTTLLASTYLGGAGADFGIAIARNPQRDVYVAGYTYSVDFPTTVGAFDQANGGGADGFVTRLSPSLNGKR